MPADPGSESRVTIEARSPLADAEHSFEYHAVSHAGEVRASNQDFALAGELPGHTGWTLLVVADGVGGQARGDWASRVATETLAAHVAEALDPADPGMSLASGIAAANEAVFAGEDASGRPATTMVCALVRDGRAWWANVGDSRIYVVRRGMAEQLSADHSWVAEQVRAGRLTEDEAAKSSQRNIITRSIGFERDVRADRGEVALRAGDRLLLCSDGVHGVISRAELARIAREGTARDAAEALVAAARAAGAPDNATAVVGCWHGAAPLADGVARTSWHGRRALMLGFAVAIIAAGVLVARSL
ncbi:MAG: serine/threonine-protein phosphatase [Dehalococcoidia bacterium]|nr:serine/threonine-protein phosphatase [Dehalococcoidia bacterium]